MQMSSPEILGSHPTVSIGMPVYNGEEYICDAIDSLLAQTFNDFELIISDNGSTDKTEQICRTYEARDKRIRYIRQAKNLGAPENFKYVLNEACGEYFMWAAHDDYWKPDFIAKALLAMNDESIGFAFPTFALRSARLGIQKEIPPSIFSGIENTDRNTRILSFANLHQSSHKCNLVYSLFRTNIIKKAYSIQDISSDTVLSLVLLGETRGALLTEHMFQKRYPLLWPGFRKKIFVKARTRARFEKERDEIIDKAKALFPELIEPLELIRKNHEPSRYHSGYSIINNLSNKIQPQSGATNLKTKP